MNAVYGHNRHQSHRVVRYHCQMWGFPNFKGQTPFTFFLLSCVINRYIIEIETTHAGAAMSGDGRRALWIANVSLSLSHEAWGEQDLIECFRWSLVVVSSTRSCSGLQQMCALSGPCVSQQEDNTMSYTREGFEIATRLQAHRSHCPGEVSKPSYVYRRNIRFLESITKNFPIRELDFSCITYATRSQRTSSDI